MVDQITFGGYIAQARKKLDMSQKELASKVLRDDGQPISPQYLNDIERDRRNPSSDHLIQQFAQALGADPDYLHYLAGSFPAEIRSRNLSEREVAEVFRAFRGGPRK